MQSTSVHWPSWQICLRPHASFDVQALASTVAETAGQSALQVDADSEASHTSLPQRLEMPDEGTAEGVGVGTL